MAALRKTCFPPLHPGIIKRTNTHTQEKIYSPLQGREKRFPPTGVRYKTLRRYERGEEAHFHEGLLGNRPGTATLPLPKQQLIFCIERQQQKPNQPKSGLLL
ncbi:hypothetical protein HNY73_014425 [Argiope bruennichi]|uniref:Uncharacterized protein n=1 Tax=Argiope bruennichi TaxID=94029 RepID=A0A8T0EQD4_ARGBR|nr:hypothetical protein HNY73_014425 [Argiope bruennichi]